MGFRSGNRAGSVRRMGIDFIAAMSGVRVRLGHPMVGMRIVGRRLRGRRVMLMMLMLFMMFMMFVLSDCRRRQRGRRKQESEPLHVGSPSSGRTVTTRIMPACMWNSRWQ
jgi:hypothetical protein